YLERCFGDTNTGPTITNISRALERFNIQFNRMATVIGWTVSSRRARCFKWSARPGSSAAHVPYAIEGSGSQHFRGLLTDVQPGGGYVSVAATSAFEKAILLGLAKVGSVIAKELSTGDNL